MLKYNENFNSCGRNDGKALHNNGLLLCSPHVKTKKTMGDRSFMVAAPAMPQ